MSSARMVVVMAAATITLTPSVFLVAQSSAPRRPAAALTVDTVSRIARLRLPSIVFVHTVREPERSSGSGVTIDPAGLVITNAHVIDGASAVRVQTADGDEFDAEVVGIDPITDLALLRVHSGRALSAAPLGRSEDLERGQWVVALGNPLELHHTVTLGIVSAVNRTISDDGLEYLQTDAAINPGSSGGALFDLEGNLVGITTSMFSRVGEDAGLNFAIPVHILRDVLPQLKQGHVVHGWIGATLVPIPRAETGGFHGRPGPTTLRVTDVNEEGPAALADLRVGDVVTGVRGVKKMSASEVLRTIRNSAPGTALPLLVTRGPLHFCVVVSVRPHAATTDR
jgi:S1-C subfamily serine protease